MAAEAAGNLAIHHLVMALMSFCLSAEFPPRAPSASGEAGDDLRMKVPSFRLSVFPTG
jgi:hypothetical protein